MLFQGEGALFQDVTFIKIRLDKVSVQFLGGVERD